MDGGTLRGSPAGAGLALASASLVAWLGLNQGGVFPGETALAGVIVVSVLMLLVVLRREPVAGIGRALGVFLAAAALLTVWTVLSQRWSHAAARAWIEGDRTLLYALSAMAAGCAAGSPDRLRWLLRGLMLGLGVVAIVGLVSRVRPDLIAAGPTTDPRRLSHPYGYWNAAGLGAGLALILALHLSSDEYEPWWAKVAASGLAVPCAATLLLTLSRGAIGATLVGVLLYLLIARPFGLLSAALSTVPGAAAAFVLTYRADLLTGDTVGTPAAVAQGRDLASTLLVLALVAALARGALTLLDRRLRTVRVGAATRRGGHVAILVAIGLAIVAAIVAFDAPGQVSRQYDRFIRDVNPTTTDQRDRLLYVGNDGRLPLWRVSRDAFEAHPAHGTGAGTYPLEWDRHRDLPVQKNYAHSLYLGLASDLGLVGLGLLAVMLLVLFVGIAMRARAQQRPLYAAALAFCATWAIHAAVDWDWETPALTIGVMAVAGVALARDRGASVARAPGWGLRAAAAAACIALGVLPALLTVSQARLDRATQGYTQARCGTAVPAAESARSTLDARPEPYAILGWCAAERGDSATAIRMMDAAVARDPGNWRFRYGAALVRARAGRDPRPDIRLALARNPRSGDLRYAEQRFAHAKRRSWPKVATKLVPPPLA